jgi:ribonuclease HII
VAQIVNQVEQILANAGITHIAGVDEAGRGACAGPLVVAAVILKDPFASELDRVRDSKVIREKEREELFEIVIQSSLAYSIIEIPSSEIDERGVHVANIEGMRRAIQGLSIPPRFVLTDGYSVPGLGFPALGIWKGDQVAHSISAASILAKVFRDRVMRKMDVEFPRYGFGLHKGYSTAKHMSAIVEYGPTPIHRRSFSNVALLINMTE